MERKGKSPTYKQVETIQIDDKVVKKVTKVDPKDEIQIPPLIVVANKAENGFIGDILEEYHQLDHKPLHTIEEPIFISAEHGDGLPDLYEAIRQFIPEGAEKIE